MTGASVDPYRSRGSDRWELAERCDPVVWGTGAPGPLSGEQIAEYRDRGFLVFPRLFAANEVAALLAETERMAAAADRSRDDVIVEPGGDAVRSIFRMHRDSAMIRALAADPRLAGAARQILGGEVYIHQSRVNFKPAFEGEPFPWHSDFETWHVEDGMPRPRALSASLLLTDNTEHNGPLLVVPGSHHRYVRCAGETPPDHFKSSLRRQEIGVPPREALTRLAADRGVASCTGPAGTVVLFDCNLMHGSGGNITPLPRHNVFLVYNSVENPLAPPFGGTAPRPDFLAERDPVPLGAT
ncbi:MAG TPA: ectoine hydroxylase [Kofleriaceae bacterium]|nr:ectoine hydroxylase [Kofleriaceae bacterium]